MHVIPGSTNFWRHYGLEGKALILGKLGYGVCFAAGSRLFYGENEGYHGMNAL
jgi:hypothetical protein